MPDASRDELRAKLRANIRSKRTGGGGAAAQQLARQARSDPTGALLNLGVDDPALLRQAAAVTKRPQAFLRHALADAAPAPQNSNEPVRTAPLSSSAAPDDDDDEEAPPPLPPPPSGTPPAARADSARKTARSSDGR